MKKRELKNLRFFFKKKISKVLAYGLFKAFSKAASTRLLMYIDPESKNNICRAIPNIGFLFIKKESEENKLSIFYPQW